jgi:hypothetical protein
LDFLSTLSRGGSYSHFLPRCDDFENGGSYNRLPNDIDKEIRLLFPVIFVLVLLPILVDYFNGYARARHLGIAAHKIMGEHSLISTSTRLCYERKKN